jgi:hypothetical protein
VAEDVIEPLLDRICEGGNVLDIPGLLYRNEGGSAGFSPSKSNSLDFFVAPDYRDFDLQAYHADRTDWLSVYAVIGCKANCEFCTIHELFPGFNHKSIENIQREMLTLRERHGSNKIFFSDSMFLGSKEKALELFDFAIDHGFQLGIQIRLAHYWHDEELIEKASKCVFYLQVGLESASPTVRMAMGKMKSHELTLSIYDLFYKYKLPLYTNMIVGYPNESEEEFLYTYEFIEKYVQQETVLGIGMNVFFLANDFPKQKYDIASDECGHWSTQQVNIADRYDRVRRLCRLGQKYGRSVGWMYRGDNIDGLPFSVEPAQGVFNDEAVTFIDDFDGTSGTFEFALQYSSGLLLRGWARLPDREECPDHILIADGDRNILAEVAPGMERPDVVAAFDAPKLQNCGWNMYLDRAILSEDVRTLIAYAYRNGSAYKLSGSFLVTAADRIRKLGENSIEDTVPWLRGGNTEAQNVAN